MEEPSDVNDFGIRDEASLHLGTVYIAPVSLAGTRIKLSINIPDGISQSHACKILRTYLVFFFISSYILFWSSIIWFIYNHHHQKLSRNKLCSLYMSSLIKPRYSLCCLLSMQCQDYSNTKCHLYIYNRSSHTIVYAVSILYTRPSYTSYQCGLLFIQIYTNSKQIL